MVEVTAAKPLHDRGNGALDLETVRVAGIDDGLGQAVGGEQHAQLAAGGQRGLGLCQRAADDAARAPMKASAAYQQQSAVVGFIRPAQAAASRQALRLLPVVVVEYCG